MFVNSLDKMKITWHIVNAKYCSNIRSLHGNDASIIGEGSYKEYIKRILNSSKLENNKVDLQLNLQLQDNTKTKEENVDLKAELEEHMDSAIAQRGHMNLYIQGKTGAKDVIPYDNIGDILVEVVQIHLTNLLL